MNEEFLRNEIDRVGKSLFARGYVHSTAGNLSARLAEGFLITPTDACLGFLDKQQLSKVDRDLRPVSGARASKTLALHAAIMNTTGAACVLHTHSTQIVLRSLRAPAAADGSSSLLPPITPYFVMKVGYVPHIPYRTPGDTEVNNLVIDAIKRYSSRATPIRSVVLERLGPVVWHDSLAQAMATLEELEETAKLANAMTEPFDALSETQIDQLRARFGAAW
jgi:3-dehydro-4-phosphotetronate decarboxylase